MRYHISGASLMRLILGLLLTLLVSSAWATDYDIRNYGANCDGNHDCSSAVSQAIAAAAAGNPTAQNHNRVLIPANTGLNGGFTMQSRSYIDIIGTGSNPGFKALGRGTQDSDGFDPYGMMRLRDCTDCIVQNLDINSNNQPANIGFFRCNDLVVQNVTVHDVGGGNNICAGFLASGGYSFTRGINNQFLNCTVYNINADNLPTYDYDSRGFWLGRNGSEAMVNLIVDGCKAHDTGYTALTGFAIGGRISNNEVWNCQGAGLKFSREYSEYPRGSHTNDPTYVEHNYMHNVRGQGWQSDNACDFVIRYNYATNNEAAGIYFNNTPAYDCVISQNTLVNNSTGGNWNGGFHMYGGENIDICYNTINGAGSSQKIGIALYDLYNYSNIRIYDNVIDTFTQDGISSCHEGGGGNKTYSNIDICTNTIRNCAGYGIDLESGNGNTFTDVVEYLNTFTGNGNNKTANVGIGSAAQAPTNGAYNSGTLSWNGSASRCYEVELSTDANFPFDTSTQQQWTVTQIIREILSPSTTVSGLSPNTTYYWRVKRLDTNGTQSAWSTTWSFNTGGGSAPAAPSGLGATSVASPVLTWIRNSTDETYFYIERSTTGGGAGFSQIGSTNAGVLTYTDNTASASTTYYYRVRAWNSNGYSGYSNEASATTPGGSQSAYNGPHNIANGNVIEAEDYDNGGSGAAYSDAIAGNEGPTPHYRNDNIDTEPCSAGGTNVGWTANGEWLEYTIANVTAGTYNIKLNVSANDANGQIVVKLGDGATFTTLGTANMPTSGYTYGWQNWIDVTIPNVVLSAGTNKVLRLELVNGGFNLNKITFEAVAGGWNFWRGIDLNGAGGVIEGNTWVSQSWAETNGGLTITGSTSLGTQDMTLTPTPADSTEEAMIETILFKWTSTAGDGWTLNQTVTNGTYRVYVWMREGYQTNHRGIDLSLEGTQAANNIGRLNLYSWAKYGPYDATVSDGVLNINFGLDTTEPGSAEPLCAGVAIYQYSAGAPPDVPILATPTDRATQQSLTPTLTWNAVSGADSYTVQTATDSGFTANAVTYPDVTDAFKVTDTLTADTNYYWHVKASNAYGESAYSETWSFSTISPLTGVSLATSIAAPRLANTKVVLTATPEGVTEGVQYQFSVSNDDGETWTTLKAFSSSTTANWTANTAGIIYILRVEARIGDAGAIITEEQPYAIITTFSAVALAVTPTGPKRVNTGLTFTATPTGGMAGGQSFIEYKFWWGVPNAQGICDSGWQTVQDWSSSPTKINWTRGTANNYQIRVQARIPTYSFLRYADVICPMVASGSQVALTTDLLAPQITSRNIKLTATPFTITNPQYKFEVGTSSTGPWTQVPGNTGFGTASNITWIPNTAGVYYLRVQARSGSTGTPVMSIPFAYAIVPPVTSVACTGNPAGSTLPKNTNIVISGVPTGGSLGNGARYLNYILCVSTNGGSSWSWVAPASFTPSFNWKPGAAGTYQVRLRCQVGQAGAVTYSNTLTYQITP